MESFEINQESSSFEIDDANNQLSLSVRGLNLQFSLKMEMWSESFDWLKDQGTGNIKMENADIMLNLVPTSQNGTLQIDFAETNLQIENYQVDLQGETDWSKATSIMMNSFKSFFKQDMANILAWRLAKSVEETLNLTLMQGGTIVGLADT